MVMRALALAALLLVGCPPAADAGDAGDGEQLDAPAAVDALEGSAPDASALDVRADASASDAGAEIATADDAGLYVCPLCADASAGSVCVADPYAPSGIGCCQSIAPAVCPSACPGSEFNFCVSDPPRGGSFCCEAHP
jgi:hypothetical protein